MGGPRLLPIAVMVCAYVCVCVCQGGLRGAAALGGRGEAVMRAAGRASRGGSSCSHGLLAPQLTGEGLPGVVCGSLPICRLANGQRHTVLHVPEELTALHACPCRHRLARVRALQRRRSRLLLAPPAAVLQRPAAVPQRLAAPQRRAALLPAAVQRPPRGGAHARAAHASARALTCCAAAAVGRCGTAMAPARMRCGRSIRRCAARRCSAHMRTTIRFLCASSCGGVLQQRGRGPRQPSLAPADLPNSLKRMLSDGSPQASQQRPPTALRVFVSMSDVTTLDAAGVHGFYIKCHGGQIHLWSAFMHVKISKHIDALHRYTTVHGVVLT